MNLIIIGPQGSGKSTQAELLAKKVNLSHLETGELYRRIAKENSLLGKKIKQFLEKGQLVSDRVHNKVLREEIKKPKYKNGFVLDGSPRTLRQAKSQPFKTDRVFYLDVSDEENIKRLMKRGREDDTPKLIARRLQLYHQKTEPVLDYYRQQGILEKVDGEKPIEEIYQDIVTRLKK